MATTIERLEELLALKDQQLEDAQERVEELERQLRHGVDWMLHERIKTEDNSLPVPRLEMRIISNTQYATESQVSLVIQERGGTISRVPLGYSRRSGSGLDIEAYPTAGELEDRFTRELPGLVNDLCFYCEHTCLSTFVVLDDDRCYKVISLRPLKLRAV